MTAPRRKDRPLEWFLAGFGLCWSAMGAASGASPSAGPAGALSPDWAFFAGAFGLAHMVALAINGAMRWTPAARLVAAALNAGVFAFSAAALAQADAALPAFSCGYAALGFAWCAYVAGTDVARMRLGFYGA